MDKTIKKELSVGTIITDGQYILGCRPYGRKDKPHSYDLPKGHIEENETYSETAVRECKEETGFDLWPDHLVDLGKYEYIPTKDLYLFLVALDFMPELSSLKCTTYFDIDGKQVPEVVSYKLIPITELHWFFKSMEPVVAQALKNFDARIEEDENAIVALPDIATTLEEEKRYFARDSGLRAKFVNPIIYRDAPACKRYIQSTDVLVSTPGPNILDHIKEHKELFGVKPENLWYIEIKPEIAKEQQAQLATIPNLKKKVHLFEGDIFELLSTLKQKNQKIGMIDFDGTDSSYLTTQVVDELLSYSDCVFLAAHSRGMKFTRRGRPYSVPMNYPSGGNIPVRRKLKTNFIQWLEYLNSRGYKFSATTWKNNSDPNGSGAPMLGILFCPSLAASSLKLILKGNNEGEAFTVHTYSFETRDFIKVQK